MTRKLKPSTQKEKKSRAKRKTLKATENKAKDMETPKEERIDLPDAAKVEITRTTKKLDNYLAGVVAGLGIKGKWAYDMQSMQLIVEEKKNGK